MKLLKLVDYDNTVLHHKTKKLEFPLATEDLALIENMKYSIQPKQLAAAGAPWEAAVGMAANQWGHDKQIFLYCPDGDTVNNLTVVINPSYEPIGSETEEMYEGCFSVPLATGKIKRYKKIKVTYYDESGKEIQKELSGWDARVWQHENDHLNGFLYDDKTTGKCLEKHTFQTKEEVEEFYNKLKTV